MEWISVKDNIPNEFSMVLIYIADNSLTGVAMLMKSTDAFGNKISYFAEIYGDNGVIEGVTHWMLLPSPPKDLNENK